MGRSEGDGTGVLSYGHKVIKSSSTCPPLLPEVGRHILSSPFKREALLGPGELAKEGAESPSRFYYAFRR